ncbi:MAG: hypothetical protein Q9161_002911 [Pseudevernia consocians]
MVTLATTVTPAKRKFCEVPTVTLLVGKSKKAFYVHQEQLCEVSPFFKAAFTSEFREGSEKKMDLVEENEDIFDCFIQWLYSQHYEIRGDGTGSDRFREPLRLFVLAEKFDISKLKNLLMAKIFAAAKQGSIGPSLSAIGYTYEHTPPSSIIRRLLADWFACKVSIPTYNDDTTQKWFRSHPEIVTDIMLSFARNISRKHSKNPFKGDMPEEYQEKEPGQED